MKNYRGTGDRVVVKAAAGRSSGVPCVEQGFPGVPETSPAINTSYTLRVEGEFEFPIVGSPTKGQTVHINNTTFALTVTAKGTAGAAGTQPFGTITAVPGDGADPINTEPKTGFMWVRLFGPGNIVL